MPAARTNLRKYCELNQLLKIVDGSILYWACCFAWSKSHVTQNLSTNVNQRNETLQRRKKNEIAKSFRIKPNTHSEKWANALTRANIPSRSLPTQNLRIFWRVSWVTKCHQKVHRGSYMKTESSKKKQHQGLKIWKRITYTSFSTKQKASHGKCLEL